MDNTIFYATAQSEPLPVDHEYSWWKARWACMGWSWAAVCGVQGRGILRGFPHSLLLPTRKELVQYFLPFCLFVSMSMCVSIVTPKLVGREGFR